MAIREIWDVLKKEEDWINLETLMEKTRLKRDRCYRALTIMRRQGIVDQKLDHDKAVYKIRGEENATE